MEYIKEKNYEKNDGTFWLKIKYLNGEIFYGNKEHFNLL